VKRLVPRHKAPLGLAAFLAMPIFFASLMAVSLAIEKPHVIEWSRPAGRIARTYHDPSAALEAKIWLLAAVPPLLLVAAGWIASYVPYGIYVPSVCAIVGGYALTIRLDRWVAHHTTRFPYGEDLYPDNTTSSLVDKGQWEHEAAYTARSLVHYTYGLALAAIAIAIFLEFRRRRSARIAPPPIELYTGGAGTATGGV